ncbi:MAG TPA: CoA-transferase [Candidatus Hydrogenedentes bacterium]|nr:CoA-transferase [Candidatus Hydrogenedentota bacterium]
MNLFTKLGLQLHTIQWVLTWSKHNNHYPSPVPENSKFVTAWQAAGLIQDGAVVGTSGIGGNQRCSLLYWAMRDRYRAEGHPKGLTVVCVGGQGGRGKVPGTLEELAVEGLQTCLIAGHIETYKAQMRLADAGKLELQCLPQGTLALLLQAQGEGVNEIINNTGPGTFIDPRTGRGTPVVPADARQYVEVLADGRFKYTLPPVDTAVFSAPAADRKGNIYAKNCAVICESLELVKAVRRNGGKVIVNVGLLVDEGYDDIFIPAEEVDAIVYWPNVEQTATIKHRKYWDCFTLNSKTSEAEGLARQKVINDFLGITPKRKPADAILARLGTRIFVDLARKGDHVDIGVGLPEEVSRLLHESGVMDELVMVNESGVFGGVAAPGIFFGAAINPREIVSSAEAFQRVYRRLDWAILGALQIDERGNVNVSKRGEGAINYVGPGGFIDLVANAKSLLFCSAWGEGAAYELGDGAIKVTAPGKPKFIREVDEITFNGQEALKQGKTVVYVTHVGAFRLTERGMELIYVMPGIEVQRDILDVCPMRIVLPESGAPQVVPENILTGRDFRLNLRDAEV